MTHVAIMIPMDDRNTDPQNGRNHVRPAGWHDAEHEAWPESRFGVPRLPAQIATETHAIIAEWRCRGVKRGIIVTRSEMAVLVARRMVAERGAFRLEVTIHFPGIPHDPAIVAPNGDVSTWPAGLFSEAAGEAKRIARAQERERKPR